MAQYEVLTCNVCSKSINRIINNSHLSINKCNLTKKCRGFLQTSVILENPLNINDKYDWESRFTETSTRSENVSKISLLSGNNNISFAVKRTGFLGASYDISLDATPTQNISSVEYVFVKPSGSRYFNGFDSSANKRFFLYNINIDDVSVYLNNVLLTEDQYDRNVLNQIRLDFPTTQFKNVVRIVVSKKIPVIDLVISPNSLYSTEYTSCFNGIKSLSIFDGVSTDKKFNVYNINNVSDVLTLNSNYKFKNITNEIYMLIGNNNRKANDYVLTHALLVTNGFSFVYDGDILTSPENIIELYPPFNITEYNNKNHSFVENQQYYNIITTKNFI